MIVLGQPYSGRTMVGGVADGKTIIHDGFDGSAGLLTSRSTPVGGKVWGATAPGTDYKISGTGALLCDPCSVGFNPVLMEAGVSKGIVLRTRILKPTPAGGDVAILVNGNGLADYWVISLIPEAGGARLFTCIGGAFTAQGSTANPAAINRDIAVYISHDGDTIRVTDGALLDWTTNFPGRVMRDNTQVGLYTYNNVHTTDTFGYFTVEYY